MPKLHKIISFVGLVGSLLAALVAAVAAETLLVSIYMSLRALAGGLEASGNLGEALVFVTLGAVYMSAQVALPTTAFVALPYVLISRALKKTTMSFYVWSGSLIGICACVASFLIKAAYPHPDSPLGLDKYFLLVSAAMSGAFAGYVFWRIARRV